MTSEDPTDPARKSTDSARRATWGIGVTDPPPRSTNPGLRAWWGLGACLVILLVVAGILSWNYRSPSSSTATGTTQSVPATTGPGGTANTGAGR
jgi:hypothetical protein